MYKVIAEKNGPANWVIKVQEGDGFERIRGGIREAEDGSYMVSVDMSVWVPRADLMGAVSWAEGFIACLMRDET